MSWSIPHGLPSSPTPPQLSGQQLSDVLESISDAFFALDRQWRFTHANSAAERLLHRRRDELLGRHVQDVLPHGVVDLLRRECERAAAQSAPVHCELLYPGTDSWYEVRGYPTDSGGLCVYLLDITARKRSEQALRESEEKFRTLAESAHAMIGIIQGERFVYTNPYLQRLSGYTREELLSIEVAELIHPDHRPAVLERAALRLRGEDAPSHYEYVMLCKGGQERWIDLSVARIDYRGSPAIIGIAYDISMRKRAEAARLESETRFDRIFKDGPLGMALIGQDERFVKVNAALCRMVGYDEQELLKLGWRDVTHPDDQPAAEKHLLEVQRGQIAHVKMDKRYVARDGSTRWGTVTVAAVQDDGGNDPDVDGHGAPQWLLMVEDITARKQHEEERTYLLRSEQTARAEAETANRRKDQFLAVLSHELRTPLTPILARLELLKRDPTVTPAVRAHLNMIRRNIELESSLISDILDISRISRGKLQLAFEAVDAHDKIREAIEIYERDILAKHLQVRMDLQAADHVVSADPARLEQVFWNLISNAVKYTPSGGVISVRSSSTPEHLLKVEVSDTGIGIEPEVMQRLFTPFEQGEQSLTRRFGGLGLGLAISKVLLNLHGGKISASSGGTGQGAQFVIELPTIEAGVTAPAVAPPPIPALAPAASGVTGAGALHPCRKPAKILLVEDNQDTARMLSRLLRKVGHKVRTADSVNGARELLTQEPYDVIISDIGLPDGSGWELMRELRDVRPTRGIALSGFGTDQDVRKSQEAGFMAHLVKPIDLNRLEAAIEQACA